MKALILAAGKGTRLKKYTENLPKGMLSFAGKTVIERQIEAFRRNGIDEIIIVRGFAADKIQYENVTYYNNELYDSTNMVVSLLTAKEEFNDDIIVSYSDIIFSDEMLQVMIKAKGDYVVSVDMQWEKYWEKRYGRIDFDTESLCLDEEGNIKSLGIPDVSPETIDARYVGLLKFSKEGLKNIVKIMEKAEKDFTGKPWQQSGKILEQAYMTDLLQAIIEDGQKVKAEKFENGWIEFDTNEDYENACKWVEDGTIRDLIAIK